MTTLKEKISAKFEFNIEAFAKEAVYERAKETPADLAFLKGARWQHNQLKNDVLPILLECYDTLEMLENYLNFSTDDLCGDDLIGDKKKTIRFEQKLKRIEQTFERLRKWSEGE